MQAEARIQAHYQWVFWSILIDSVVQKRKSNPGRLYITAKRLLELDSSCVRFLFLQSRNRLKEKRARDGFEGTSMSIYIDLLFSPYLSIYKAGLLLLVLAL